MKNIAGKFSIVSSLTSGEAGPARPRTFIFAGVSRSRGTFLPRCQQLA